MKKEIMPEYEGELSSRFLFPPHDFEGSKKLKQSENHCVVFCKKVAPNVFDISKGVAVLAGAENLTNDGICMIAPAAKVVFVFE